MKNLIVISGPTSTGKTSMALELSNKFDTSIISADSRQIYKYMDIGTGKMPLSVDSKIKREYDRWVINDIDVWGYDLVAPDLNYSAYEYTLYALNKIKSLFLKSDIVFLVGGTGFYIDSVLGEKKLSSIVPDPILRDSLSKISTLSLADKLKQLNPAVYEKTDLNNRVRLVRAIEREVSGSTHNPDIKYLTDVRVIKIGLTSDRTILFNRSDFWVTEIWKNGLLNETEDLISSGYAETPRMQSLIYSTTVNYLNGLISEHSALDRIKYDIHSYIRRQLTWFKKGSDINWFDINSTDYKQTVYNFIVTKI